MALARLPWEAAVLLTVAALAFAFQVRLPTLLPSEADDRAAAQVLAKEAEPGDVLLLHPWWTERARLFAPPGLPVVGYLGSEGDPLEDHPRIWVLSQPHLPYSGAASFADRFISGRTQLGPSRSLGPLTLTLYRNGRYQRALFRASDALSQAHVYVENEGGRVACEPDGRGGDVCMGGIHVVSEWHELAFVPFHCISLSPPGGRAALVLELPSLPAHSMLVLEAGVVWEHAAKHYPGLTPLEVELQRGDGTVLSGLSIPPGREGMQRASVTPSPEEPLRLRVFSRRREEREACVELRALASPEPG
jgi:hypothetical protein